MLTDRQERTKATRILRGGGHVGDTKVAIVRTCPAFHCNHDTVTAHYTNFHYSLTSYEVSKIQRRPACLAIRTPFYLLIPLLFLI